MFNKLLIAGLVPLLTLLAPSAQAVPLAFTNVTYGTSAQAIAEGVTDTHAATNPSSALPLITTSTSAGLNDFANAASVASTGLLTANSYVDSLTGAASASAATSFAGSFRNAGALRLTLDFNTFGAMSGGSGAGMLSVLLTNTLGGVTTTLFNNVYTDGGSYLLEALLPNGGVSQLSLMLTSNSATTGGVGSAQMFAQVGFAGAVPEPETWLLFAGGIGLLALRRRAA